MDHVDAVPEAELLRAAGRGDQAAFERLVAGYRRELSAYCYRMLGSIQDAEEASQASLLAALRGPTGFEGRAALRTWLYRIATDVCLQSSTRRPRRLLSPDHGPARRDTARLGEPVPGPIWLEPWPDEEPAGVDLDADPAARYLRRESVELAFVAALQSLPAAQRAVLILREVPEFSVWEVADILDSTPAVVDAALQRARSTVGRRLPAASQQDEAALLGEAGRSAAVAAFGSAWERADVPALLELLAADARLTMAPLPAWFDGREDVGRFFAERVFAAGWRLKPFPANGQPGYACYTREPGARSFRLAAVNVLTLRGGRIAEITGFLDPDLHRRLGLATHWPEDEDGSAARN
ncbi:RNA polymerase subunit sigma-70 [Embleya sp. NPDC050493]|uniref:RNA polymerase subunit sigma-70 n=1 Tax=Embleya sp. NPDC050493 TaxID=3363989 RepID=UPI00379A5360